MVSLAKYTITESRANVIVARALFFEHVFLAFLDIFELPATRAPSGPATTFRLPSAGQPADSSRRLRACALLRAPHGASQPSRTAPAPVTSSGRCTGGVPARWPAVRRQARPERGPGRPATFRSWPAEAPARCISGPGLPDGCGVRQRCGILSVYAVVALSVLSSRASPARPNPAQLGSARPGLSRPGGAARHRRMPLTCSHGQALPGHVSGSGSARRDAACEGSLVAGGMPGPVGHSPNPAHFPS